MGDRTRVEKFSASELNGLRNDLMRSGLDSWQAADVISGFLSGRGYGASAEELRTAVQRLDITASNIERMQATLEQIAFVM